MTEINLTPLSASDYRKHAGLFQVRRLQLIGTYSGLCAHKMKIKRLLPALNNTIAFMHANSAGSTLMVRNRRNVSFSTRMSAATWLALPLGMAATWSEGLNSGLFSSGKHHWTAFNRNSSDQHSSKSITYKQTRPRLYSNNTKSERKASPRNYILFSEGEL